MARLGSRGFNPAATIPHTAMPSIAPTTTAAILSRRGANADIFNTASVVQKSSSSAGTPGNAPQAPPAGNQLSIGAIVLIAVCPCFLFLALFFDFMSA